MPEDNPSAETAAERPSRRKYRISLLSLPLALILLIWSLNYVLVQRIVDQALNSDSRNSVFTLSSHYRFYVDPMTLVLDLRDVSNAAPADLFRGLFHSAAALQLAGRTFDQVVLARRGEPIFTMSGEEFGELGTEFERGQNPIFLIRTLPEKLHEPSGANAFGHWEGGLIGVTGKQITDANEAGRRWAGGQ